MIPGIHGSRQIETEDPSPMRFSMPVTRAYLPATIARQVAEDLFGTVACIKSVSGKYFVFKILAHKKSGWVINLHPCHSLGRQFFLALYVISNVRHYTIGYLLVFSTLLSVTVNIYMCIKLRRG
jgi:hypothetical protein